MGNGPLSSLGQHHVDEAEAAWNSLESTYERLRDLMKSQRSEIENIIHIGIGGSFLGPKLIEQSLDTHFENSAINIHFLSNIDGHEVDYKLSKCDPENTIVIAVSKTFSTLETISNMKLVEAWFENSGIENFKDKFFAVTASKENAAERGILPTNIVAFPEWVGGRYSVWSSVSMSVILKLGLDGFKQFLRGADEVDQYFVGCPLKHNVCFISAVLDHYYVNYMGTSSRAIFPYDFRLRSLVDYLQQLETESNGKDRDIFGFPVKGNTSPIVWGGIGTDVQHSVFQLLHQGTHLVPSEFVLVKKPDHSHSDHHKELLANGLAQAAALLKGQSIDEVQMQEDSEASVYLNAKIFSGNRPSSTILIDELTPRTLGQLLAFYENRTLSFGLISSINSFDQMGVELGKRLANKMSSNRDSHRDFDPSTQALLKALDL